MYTYCDFLSYLHTVHESRYIYILWHFVLPTYGTWIKVYTCKTRFFPNIRSRRMTSFWFLGTGACTLGMVSLFISNFTQRQNIYLDYIVYWRSYSYYLYFLPLFAHVVSSNPAHGEVYSLQHYVIKFVSDLWPAGSFLRFPPLIKLTVMI